MKNTLFFGALSLMVFGTGCGVLSQGNIYEEKEIFDSMEETTARAIEQNDLSICAFLPVKALYQNGDTRRGSLVHYTLEPRGRCYWEFAQKTKQSAACEALDGLTEPGFRNGSQCYEYFAQAKNDISFCLKMKNGREICEAKVSKRIEPCYELKKDESDTSRYSRSVQYCIGSVALRIKSVDPCLKIDGPDYGEQWRYGRNSCIEHVASLLNLKGPNLAHMCEMMVDDEDGFDNKKRCLVGEVVSGVEQQLLPYGDGVGL